LPPRLSLHASPTVSQEAVCPTIRARFLDAGPIRDSAIQFYMIFCFTRRAHGMQRPTVTERPQTKEASGGRYGDPHHPL